MTSKKYIYVKNDVATRGIDGVVNPYNYDICRLYEKLCTAIYMNLSPDKIGECFKGPFDLASHSSLGNESDYETNRQSDLTC